MRGCLDRVVLPSEVTAFERAHLARLNRIALGVGWAHVVVLPLVALAFGHSPWIAMILAAIAMAGPSLAMVAFREQPRRIGVVFGVAAALLGGVLVYCGEGPLQIEMHFYFFVAIALLAIYGNPAVVLATTASVLLHHVVLWFVLPAAVFNYDASLWTVAVHGLFVMIESVAACFVARSFFDNVIGLERVVAQRTAQLHGAEVELRQAQKLEAIGRLSAGIAHELNTPIQYVQDSVAFIDDGMRDTIGLVGRAQELCESAAYAEALDAASFDYLEKNMPRAIGRAREGLGRMAAIVRSLKEFSHPDRERAPSDLNRGLLATIEIARTEYKQVADVDAEFGDLPLVDCHIGEVNQVFLNIIVNAAHAIADYVRPGERGRISIRTWADATHAHVAIKDTGTGIPETVLGQIFEPFFTTKEVGRGTGQGLAIARAVIERHGGTIAVKTKVNDGSTFTISLPIAAQVARAA